MKLPDKPHIFHEFTGIRAVFISAYLDTWPYLNVTKACKEAGINRHTYYDWRNKDQEFADCIDNAVEAIKDWAEGKLLEHMDEPKDKQISLRALMFYLERKCAKRGYAQKQELTGSDGGPVRWEAVERFIVSPPVGPAPPKEGDREVDPPEKQPAEGENGEKRGEEDH